MQPNDNNNQNNNFQDKDINPIPEVPNSNNNDTMQPLEPPESATSPFAPEQPAQTIETNTAVDSSFNATITTDPAQPANNQAPVIPAEQQPVGPNPNLTIVNNVPKPKKSPVIAIIIILLVILLAGGGAAAYFILGNNKTAPKQTSSQSTPSQSSDSTPNNSLPANKVIAFEFPLKIEGWTSELLNNQGLTKYVSNDKNCQITFSQNKGTNSETPSAVTTVDNYIDQVQQGLTSSITTSTIGNMTIDKKEFIGKKMQYTGNDKIDYIVTVHAYTQDQYQLIIVKACKRDQWDSKQSILDELISKISIVEA